MKLSNIFLLVLLPFLLSNTSNDYLKVNVKDYGAKGDGISNDYTAIMKAVDIINKNGGGEIYFPSGEYFINEYHNGINEIKNIIFKDCNRLVIKGDNAKISVKGNFNRTVTKRGKKHLFSNITAIIPLGIINCKNVLVEGLEINGNVDQMTKDKKVVESGGHLVLILDSENVTLSNLKIHHAQTDGIYIGKNSKNVNAINTTSSNNARQGMSITGLIRGEFVNCKFMNTGITEGDYGRHAPSAGVDIEPNRKSVLVKNIKFENCLFQNNMGAQLVVSHPNTTENIFFYRCDFNVDSGKRKYAVIVNAKKVFFNKCKFDLKNSNIYPFWHKSGTSSVFKNSEIKSNYSGIVAVNYKGTKSVEIDSCSFKYTGNKILTSYFPYIRTKNMIFSNNKIEIPEKYYKAKGPNSLIENVSEVYGNTFYNESKIVKPIVSYRGSNVIK